jgi:hypothetical protein
MNVSSSQPLAGDAAQGAQMSRDAAGSAQSATLGASGADGAYAAFGSDGFTSSGQAAYTGLQTAASYVQAASGYLGQVTSLLRQMASLSDLAQNSSGAAQAGAEVAFSAAQGELSGIIGGAEQVGSPQGATFGGSELFGPSTGDTTVATGLSQVPTIALGGTNLRQGAVLGLIRKGSAGEFLLGASDPAVSRAIAGALQQAGSASDCVSGTQAMVDMASSELEVGEQNQASLILTPEGAAEASQSAAAAVLGMRGGAVAAYSGLPSQSSLGLLQAVQA